MSSQAAVRINHNTLVYKRRPKLRLLTTSPYDLDRQGCVIVRCKQARRSIKTQPQSSMGYSFSPLAVLLGGV